VKVTPRAGLPAGATRQTVDVLDFAADGIVIRVLDTAGNRTATGFHVEITQIGGLSS